MTTPSPSDTDPRRCGGSCSGPSARAGDWTPPRSIYTGWTFLSRAFFLRDCHVRRETQKPYRKIYTAIKKNKVLTLNPRLVSTQKDKSFSLIFQRKNSGWTENCLLDTNSNILYWRIPENMLIDKFTTVLVYKNNL